MKITQSTNIGRRDENQDAMFFKEYEEGVLAVVCDGMGGGLFGKEAATLACTTFFDTFDYLYKTSKLRDCLLSAMTDANAKVYNAAKGEVMGTTCVAGFVTDDNASIVNIGDSRAYIIFYDDILQITNDHSYVQEAYERGEITLNQIKTHPKRNMLTRVLGIYPEMLTDYFEVNRRGGRIMFCTDGLTNTIEDDKLLKIFNKSKRDTISKNLTEISVMNGGKDNITVIVID